MLLKVSEVAEKLRVHFNKVIHVVKKHNIPHIRTKDGIYIKSYYVHVIRNRV